METGLDQGWKADAGGAARYRLSMRALVSAQVPACGWPWALAKPAGRDACTPSKKSSWDPSLAGKLSHWHYNVFRIAGSSRTGAVRLQQLCALWD